MPTKKEKVAEKAPKDVRPVTAVSDNPADGNKPMTDEKMAERGLTPEADKEKGKAAAKAKKDSFDVYNRGGALVRTYSVEAHGKDAEDLAKEYAKKIGGEVE